MGEAREAPAEAHRSRKRGSDGASPSPIGPVGESKRAGTGVRPYKGRLASTSAFEN